MIYFTLILLVVFAFFLGFLIHTTSHVRKQTREELSFSSQCYGGPAGEPRWEGQLPAHVDDYTEPRYVYENLTESGDYLPENGRIIGYRISPELVIHSRIHCSINTSCLSSYIARYGGKLLNIPTQEVTLLLDNWQKVSQLREKAGDTPLDVKSFWALSEEQIPVCVDVESRTYKNIIGFNYVWCALILKR